MAAPTGTLIDKQNKRIEEVISKNLEIFSAALDPFWRDTILSAQNVGPNDLLGRDYLLYKVYMNEVGGVIDSALPYSEFGLYGDKNSTALAAKFYSQQLLSVFPDASEGVQALPYVLKCQLRGVHTNLQMTLAELRAEATPAFIGQVVAPKFKGFANTLAHQICLSWYINQSFGYVLSPIKSGSLAIAGSGPYTITFEPYNNATHRYRVGMRVDLYDGGASSPGAISGTTDRKNDSQSARASQTTYTRLPLYVAAVDPILNKVVLAAPDDPAGWAGNAGADPDANDVIVLANSCLNSGVTTGTSGGFSGIAGINSWMKFGTGTSGIRNDNYLLGAEAVGTADNGIIDVTVHPEFKSLLKDLGSTPLTEHKLRQYIRAWNRAKKPIGQTLDCLVASDGVWLAYEAQKIGREMIDRTGRLSSINSEGSQEGFSFTFDGQTVHGYTSNFVEANTVYGHRKGGGNWKRYVPPDPSGVTRMGEVMPSLPFRFALPPINGGSKMRLITRAITTPGNTLPTEGADMPGILYQQLVPDQPAGLKLTSVSEDRVYGDTAFAGIA